MVRCAYDGCGWQAIAPSPAAAREQYAAHVLAEHTRSVNADVPEGMVQIRTADDDEWETVAVEEAFSRHETVHDD